MYEEIKSLKPYFHSLREIEGNVSLDIKFPLNWKHEEIIAPYRTIKTKIQDKNEKFNLMSLISMATKEGYDVVFACALDIININKEEELKRKLFEQKVNELKVLFQNESLDKLKDINFLNNEQQDFTSIRMVNQGDDERREGDTGPQEEDDKRDIEVEQERNV